MVPDALLDAALRTFAERGPTKARLEDIRKQAGMSVGAVYHHVADKEDLGHAVYADALSRYQDGLLALLRDQPGAEAGIRAGVRHHLEWCARHPRETRFLQTGRGFADEARLQELNRPFLREVRAWWRTHAHYGALKDLDLDVANALWLGPAQELVRHASPKAAAAHADLLADAAWEAVKA